MKKQKLNLDVCRKCYRENARHGRWETVKYDRRKVERCMCPSLVWHDVGERLPSSCPHKKEHSGNVISNRKVCESCNEADYKRSSCDITIFDDYVKTGIVPCKFSGDGSLRRKISKGFPDDCIYKLEHMVINQITKEKVEMEMLKKEDVLPAMTAEDKARLQVLENKVRDGMKSFIEVGKALAEIRENKYYREQYKTFEDYCKTEWDMSSSNAYHLTDGYQVVQNLYTSTELIGGYKPISEAQVRPLVKLDREEQIKVWKKVVETCPAGKIPTKDMVIDVLAEVIPDKAKAKVKKLPTKMTLEKKMKMFQAMLNFVPREDWEKIKDIILDNYHKQLKPLAKAS